MVRCSTPDTLIGLGGGGSKVVYRFMEQQWILDEVLGEGPSEGNHGHDTLRATTIDTATGEMWHEDRVKSVEKTVQTAIDKSEYVERDRYLEFEGPTIIPDEIPTGWKNEQLTASNSIANLRSEVGLNSWWLENGRDPLDNVNNKGFDSGVDQLRSVSKALFHITQQKNVNCEPVAVPPEGEVCIVTSLGGGTGSGLAIDLATSLNDKHNNIDNIHLYGILPHTSDDIGINTNAYAALSELEYAELAGESPFDTITLVPHLEAVEEKDTKFEMAIVRTILARQNGGDQVKQLRPSQDEPSAAPDYAPFTVASPVTLRYDFEAKEKAKDVVEDTLDKKRDELRNEKALYDVVEQFLTEAFTNTAGAEVGGAETNGRLDFDDGRQRPIELRRRIEESLWTEFLGSDALNIANLSETVNEINDVFEDICDEEAIGIQDITDEVEQAKDFIEIVPEQLEDQLEFGYTEQDGSKYKLVEAVRQEVENIRRRRDIYRGISHITAEENQDQGLSERQAEMIRTVLAEVVIDDEKRYPSREITKPRLREKISELNKDLDDYGEEVNALKDEYKTIARDIKSRRGQWFNKISEEAEKLAAINRDSTTVTAALSDLTDSIDRACSKVNNADGGEIDGIELDLDGIGPLGSEDENINGIAPINTKLKKMGIDSIPSDEIQTRFECVKDARKLEINHGGWIGSDNSEEFIDAAQEASKDGWFSINGDRDTTDIEDEFECSFDNSKLEVEDQITKEESKAVNAITTAFVEVFAEDHNTFKSYDIESKHAVKVPSGSSPQMARKSLESGLQASTKEDANDLLNDVIPVTDIDPDEPSAEPLSEKEEENANNAAMMAIVEAYLEPIGSAYENANERYEALTDGENSMGIISQLKTLRALAEGSEKVDDPPRERAVSVSIFTPDEDWQITSMNGTTFVENYDGIYGFDLDDSFKYESDQNPFVVPMETKPADLAGDPEDISDTDILKNRSDEIEAEFRRETAKLIRDNERAPYEVSIRGNAKKSNDTHTAYKQHRIRQVYLSRGLDENSAIGEKYEEVYNEYVNQNMPLENSDIYNADTYPYGWGDDITMVTFVGGLFLDNISLVSEPNGYRDNYQATYDKAGFPGSHHTIGLGAMWDRWSVLGNWVTDAWEEANPESDADFGGFVYRDEVYDPKDQSFVEEIKYRNEADGMSATDLFLDALTADAYENTVEIDQQQSADKQNSRF